MNIYLKSVAEFNDLKKEFTEPTVIHIQFSEWVYISAWENSHVIARENSHVIARENSHVIARENSHVEARENSHVIARENSHVIARENSHVEARENSHVIARENSHVIAWENSHVEARGNSHVETWGNSCCHTFSTNVEVILMGFSVLFSLVKHKFTKKSNTATVIEPSPQSFFERDGVEFVDGLAIVYKRVSEDFKTQENTKNETVWKVGSEIVHENWNPQTQECGEGKFHACSKGYFCDEFRSTQGDKYVAIKVAREDFFEWPNPQYPHKIAFRAGLVLFECDRYGNKI